MSEYELFRAWSEAKARELSGRPEAERDYLRDMHTLAGEFLTVSHALHELSRGSIFSFWKKLRRFGHVASDPLAAPRAAMRRIRQRHG
jgi:hypothetical protein